MDKDPRFQVEVFHGCWAITILEGGEKENRNQGKPKSEPPHG
jgi:hypothetical protein